MMSEAAIDHVKIADADIAIHGAVADGFGPVLEAFKRNFADHGEVGGSVAAYVDGRRVVDLWGGHRDAERTRPWDRDTMTCIMSATKGISAICAHIQRDRGLLDYDAPVAAYWPEFAQAGKDKITVRQLMSHEAAVPVADAAPPGSAMGWDALIQGLEVQAPIWEPGSKAVYHSTTYGHLVGELVRRTSGKSLSEFIRSELAQPLHADVHLGLTESELDRFAPNIFNPANELMTRPPKADPIFARTYRLMLDEAGAPPPPLDFVRGTFASGGGCATADGLARIFAALACGGSLGDVRLTGPDTIALATQEQNFGPDPMHGDPFRNALGFVLNTPEWSYYGPNPRSFGTVGGGGYGVFADPDRRLSFAYVPVRFTSGYGIGDEQRRLVDALYQAF